MQAPKNIAIIAIGNTLRSDDGIGTYACNLIKQLQLPNVTLFELQQLDAELIETLLPFDHVVIVDATIKGDDVQFYPVADKENNAVVTSHHMNAATLQLLSQKIYNKLLPLHVCAVKGFQFEIGNTISAQAKTNATKAAAIIADWIKSFD